MAVPSYELGLPHPFSRKRVDTPSRPKRGGHTCLRVRGSGSPTSDDLRKSLALSQLCGLLTSHVLPFVVVGNLFYVAVILLCVSGQKTWSEQKSVKKIL